MQAYASGVRHLQALTPGILAIVFLSLFPGLLHAGGPVYGAKAAGMGTAFTAVADDPSAIAFNPAGLVNVRGTHAYAGATAIFPSTRVESIDGRSERTDFKVFVAPHLFLTDDFGKKDLGFGLGLFSPYGIGGRFWSREGLTRYASTECTIATFTINPVAAWKVRPWLSVGGGPYYLLAKSTAEKMVDQSSLGWQDGKFRLDGDGGGYGYSLGLLVTPVKKISFGIDYWSAVNVDLKGTAKITRIAPPLQAAFGGSSFKTDVTTRVCLPQSLIGGIAWRPSDKLTVASDLIWGGWSSFRNQKIDFKDEVPAAGITDMIVPQEWENTLTFTAGVDWKVNRKLSLRAGYVYNDTQVPGETLSPASPEATQQSLCIGFGYGLSDKVVLDAFILNEFYRTRKVHNDILSGTYENSCIMSGMSIGYHL